MQDIATVTNWPLHMHYGITLWAYLSVALIKDSHKHLKFDGKKTQYCVLQVTWSQLLLRRWMPKSARRQNRENRHTDRHTHKTNTTRCTVNLVAYACQGLISSGTLLYVQEHAPVLYMTACYLFLDANVHCLSRQTIFAISQTSLQVSVSSRIQLSCERNHPGLLIASVSLYIHQWINMHAFE